VQKPVYEEKLHEPELENKVVGVNPVMELLKAGGRTVDTLFIDSTKGGKIFNDLITTARGLGITVKFAPKEALDGMSVGLRHQGAVAVVSPKEYADPDVLLAAAFAGETMPLFILLDGVEDPQNLGAVIRTADCAGVDGVFIPEHRAAHLSASVSKASAGAIEHVPVAKVGNMAKFIQTLKDRGVWVVGVEAGSDNVYTGFRMDVPVAVVLGGEGTGVRPVVLKSCDEVVSLPMFGHVNSLNVSVAAGVVLYEVLRQRMG
jgi:23S rRNA (guanosine2251-2'-O)-methyltransferase